MKRTLFTLALSFCIGTTAFAQQDAAPTYRGLSVGGGNTAVQAPAATQAAPPSTYNGLAVTPRSQQQLRPAPAPGTTVVAPNVRSAADARNTQTQRTQSRTPERARATAPQQQQQQQQVKAPRKTLEERISLSPQKMALLKSYRQHRANEVTAAQQEYQAEQQQQARRGRAATGRNAVIVPR